jgi:hypothetical protein
VHVEALVERMYIAAAASRQDAVSSVVTPSASATSVSLTAA